MKIVNAINHCLNSCRSLNSKGLRFVPKLRSFTKIIFLGAPGSGKGTVASRLSKEFGLVHLSTGDLFREEIAKGTKLGKEADKYISKGNLVPDEITLGIVKDKIKGMGGIIFDGFPRTLEQAKGMEKFVSVNLVVSLEVTEKMAVERISFRRTCSKCKAIYHMKYIKPKKERVCDKCGGKLYQRDDEKPEVVKERFKIYHKQSLPLVDYYSEKGVLHKVDGAGKPEEVYGKVKEAVQTIL